MDRQATSLKSPGRSGGFSLIEVLISLVILSVGLLGIAAMVSVSLKSKESSYYRSQATALSYAILDRMRANRAPASTSAYDVAIGQTLGNNLTGQSITVPTGDCTAITSPCNNDQIAALDLTQWKFDLANTLPSGDGSISTVTWNSTTQVTITVQWNDKRATQSVETGAATYGTSVAPAAATLSFSVISGL
ncbi:MAG TPA: type IV pilus modification protein PilV [Gammaproteobacteria bacterium]|nr:type IV pilus modification protein PilV [Gammaproteobacteria bacterium]